MSACPHCTTENPDDTQFCSNCGVRLGTALSAGTEAPAASTDPQTPGSGAPGAGAVLAPLGAGCLGVAGGIFAGFALALGAMGLAGKSHTTGFVAQGVVLLSGILALVWLIRAARAPASPLHAPVVFAFLVGCLVTTLGAFSLCSGIFLENPSYWETPQPQFTISPLLRPAPKGPAGHSH
jgi:hypothetical protein